MFRWGHPAMHRGPRRRRVSGVLPIPPPTVGRELVEIAPGAARVITLTRHPGPRSLGSRFSWYSPGKNPAENPASKKEKEP